MRHLGDITQLSGWKIPIVDIITGGSPCQDLSVAGQRKGLAGDRSGLFMEQIRIVKEMRERDGIQNGRTGYLRRPRYMVWENVPGAFSSNKGRDFQTVLTEIVKVADPKAPDVPMPQTGWSKSGCLYSEVGDWSIAWRLHDAQFWGVPQRRKRITLVADFGGLSAPEVLFERKGMRWHSSESREAEQEAAASLGGGSDSTIPINDKATRYKGGGATRRDDGAGNGLGGGNEGDPAPTLSAGDRHGVYVPPVARSLTARADGSPCADRGPDVIAVYDARGRGGGKTAPTMVGDHFGHPSDYTALCIGNGQLNQISKGEKANTLDTMHDQQAVLIDPDVAHTLKTKANSDHREDSETYVQTRGMVRRLTPTECERLQGFPDGWTDIGDWTDSKGKRHKAADGPRYKALGNSIALPFWEWLARRICAQYERGATLGSLFDGIGGFPRVFERCGAKAVWASEIEEFPIAVTKKHFPEVGNT